MGRFAILLSSLALLLVLQNAQAGPACARRNEGNDNCLSECGSKWGWPGRLMGTDPWGQVMTVTATDYFGAAVTKACRVRPTSQSAPAASPSATQPVANDSTPSSAVSISSPQAKVAPPPSPSIVSSASPSVNPSASLSSLSSSASFAPISSASSSVTASSSSATPSQTSLAPSSSKLVKVPRPSTVAPPSSTPNPASTPEAPPTAAPVVTTQQEPPASSAAPTTPSASSSFSDSSPAQKTTSGDPGNGASQSDINEYLSDHNTVRAQHGAAPLTWNNTLADAAQQWANNCVFQHSGGTLGPFGENLAAGTGSSYGIDAAIQSWTSEVSQYDASNPQPSHFTQVVWKGTTEVGCAVQECSGIFDPSFGLAQYFVCEYFPQGNIIGEFPQNVQV
ncbi:PR-1-like protein [Obba rivulosa]|uniref:PR-1-like protein n=1 Tax=Obba rivulosa TaxID=1052685 RepID=A0A8E2J748_9APHY|nr:PR-1-like protein [Obba rivulosa]